MADETLPPEVRRRAALKVSALLQASDDATLARYRGTHLRGQELSIEALRNLRTLLEHVVRNLEEGDEASFATTAAAVATLEAAAEEAILDEPTAQEDPAAMEASATSASSSAPSWSRAASSPVKPMGGATSSPWMAGYIPTAEPPPPPAETPALLSPPAAASASAIQLGYQRLPKSEERPRFPRSQPDAESTQFIQNPKRERAQTLPFAPSSDDSNVHSDPAQSLPAQPPSAAEAQSTLDPDGETLFVSGGSEGPALPFEDPDADPGASTS